MDDITAMLDVLAQLQAQHTAAREAVIPDDVRAALAQIDATGTYATDDRRHGA
jgi:hypothetical protein